jgi:hypothetical protein
VSSGGEEEVEGLIQELRATQHRMAGLMKELDIRVGRQAGK